MIELNLIFDVKQNYNLYTDYYLVLISKQHNLSWLLMICMKVIINLVWARVNYKILLTYN